MFSTGTGATARSPTRPGGRARDRRGPVGLGVFLCRRRSRRPARSVRRQLSPLRSADRARAGRRCELHVEGHPGQLRAQGPSHRYELLYRNPARDVRRRVRTVRRRPRDGPVSDDRRGCRFHRRRVDGHLRRVRLDGGDSLPQQQGRNVYGRCRREWNRVQRGRQPQAGMGSRPGDYNNDGLLDLVKTHFADDIPALYRNLGRDSSRMPPRRRA